MSDELGFWIFALAVAWVISVLVARSRTSRLERRIKELAEENQRHAAAGTVLHERLEALRLRVEHDEELIARAPRAPSPVEPAPSRAVVASPIESAAVEAPPVDARSFGTPSVETPPVESPAVAPPPVEAPAAATPAVEMPPVEAPAGETLPVEAPGPGTPPVEPPPEPSAAPDAPPPVPEAVVEPPPPARGFRAPDWESLVGVRLFSWIAGIALVIAAVSFLRYSVEQGLLGPPIRLAIGVVTGVALLVTSETRGRHRWSVTADAFAASGIAILFATFFAGSALWHLIPQVGTFALMVLVTAVAVLLAIRHDSLFIALLGLVGGFATPILLSTGEDRPIGLFGYLLVLNAGLAWVGRRRGWTVLIALSVGFTAIYQWGWVMKFLLDRPAELPIAVAVFLVFPVLVALTRLVPAREDGAAPRYFEETAATSALLPLLFALCFAWVPALGDHYVLLFVYLFLLDLGLAVIAVATRSALLHGAAALVTLLVFAGWLSSAYGAYAWPAVLGFVALFVLFYLAAPIVARRVNARMAESDRPPVTLLGARVAAPLLLFTFPVLVFLEPAAASPLLPFAVMFALLVAIAVVALVESAGPLHFLGAFFAVVAEAVWSARHLAPERLHAALLLYGAFGVFHLAVPVVARRLQRRLEPGWSAPALLIASLGLLLFLAAGPVAHLALWGMAILLAILNLGLFFDMRPGRLSWLAGLGMVLSWIVIAVWWATAMVASLLLPALAIVGGFAVLLVGGNLWAERQSVDAAAARKGVYLGLVGHLFLLFVASQGALAAPPWPLLGVLFVLDLAILVAALYARRAELHVAAVVASQVVLAVWVWTAHRLPSSGLAWPEVGLLAALVVAGLSLVALPLARRRGAEHVLFPAASAAALLGVLVVVAVAGTAGGEPLTAWLVVVGAVGLIVLSAVAGPRGWHWLPMVALAPYAVGTFGWMVASDHVHPEPRREALVLSAVPYAIWLVYPVWQGARALRSRTPYVTAVLASGLFFLFARITISGSELDKVVGVLPVTQAALLVGLLAHLLRAEPSEGRDRGRLALVAGTALAFVTAAIPLQLDKQWITIGWGLEAAALAWLYRRVVHKGLLATSGGLSLAVVLRLSLNRAVLSYHPRGAHPIWNWYLYAYLVSAVALLLAATALAETDDRFAKLPALPRVSSLTRAGATVLLFLLLNIEIADYWSTGSEITFNFSSGIAQDLTYTLGWAVFAIALLTVGIVRKSRGARLAALLLLVVTVAKCFLHDLWRLGGLYRVGSFVGLAVSLALVAVILQRFVLPPDTTKRAP